MLLALRPDDVPNDVVGRVRLHGLRFLVVRADTIPRIDERRLECGHGYRAAIDGAAKRREKVVQRKQVSTLLLCIQNRVVRFSTGVHSLETFAGPVHIESLF